MAEKGIVQWYSVAKGYGFVRRAETGEDVFVHHSAVTDAGLQLTAGEEVSFEVVEGPKGLRGEKLSKP